MAQASASVHAYVHHYSKANVPDPSLPTHYNQVLGPQSCVQAIPNNALFTSKILNLLGVLFRFRVLVEININKKKKDEKFET